MNWTAFWLTIIFAPIAIYLMHMSPLLIVKSLWWWNNQSLPIRNKIKRAAKVLEWMGAIVSVVGVAAVVGYAAA